MSNYLKKSFNKPNFQDILSILLPFAIFVFHALLFRNWIIDDAGISFVYSRNLAQGFGLVSQPGMQAVEGFSNFTWVILIAPFFILNLFDPIITPKILSLILILFTYICIQKTIIQITQQSFIPVILVLFFLSINTSFVVWTTSGLENPLYAFIIILLINKILEFIDSSLNTKDTVMIAFLAVFCALTRPDGIIYFGVLPMVIIIYVITKRFHLQDVSKQMILYIFSYALFFGSFLVFRYYYFNDVFPNTYYAKGGIDVDLLQTVHQKINILFSSILLPFPLYIFLSFSLFVIKKQRNLKIIVVFTLFLFSLINYILLPRDWMGEFRFATPFFIAAYLYFFLCSYFLIQKIIPENKLTTTALFLLLSIFLATSVNLYLIRSKQFAEQPTVPFSIVAEQYSFFDKYATQHKIENASLLAPDLGGTLYYSNLRVYDLAGLTDRVVARSLGINQQAFYNYVFEVIKPTFIHTHQWWAYIANFDKDERFRRDYIAIDENIDKWVIENYGIEIYSGNYVRWDAIK